MRLIPKNKKTAAWWWFLAGLLGLLAVTFLLEDLKPDWLAAALRGGITGGCFAKALLLEREHQREEAPKE